MFGLQCDALGCCFVCRYNPYVHVTKINIGFFPHALKILDAKKVAALIW